MPQDMPDIDPVQYAIDNMLDDIYLMDKKIQVLCQTLKALGNDKPLPVDLESCQIRSQRTGNAKTVVQELKN
jgi:serine O-acetyltransferase